VAMIKAMINALFYMVALLHHRCIQNPYQNSKIFYKMFWEKSAELRVDGIWLISSSDGANQGEDLKSNKPILPILRTEMKKAAVGCIM
jgi:hypothetical protein